MKILLGGIRLSSNSNDLNTHNSTKDSTRDTAPSSQQKSSSNKNTFYNYKEDADTDKRLGVANLSNYVSGDATRSSSSHQFHKDS